MANILEEKRDKIKREILEDSDALQFYTALKLVQRYIDYKHPPNKIKEIIYALEDLRELFLLTALIQISEEEDITES